MGSENIALAFFAAAVFVPAASDPSGCVLFLACLEIKIRFISRSLFEGSWGGGGGGEEIPATKLPAVTGVNISSAA